MEDYSVRVLIRFQDTTPTSRNNSLITTEERRAMFQVNIKNVIMNDYLSSYVDFDSLFFRYDDSYVLFSYVISCHDEDEDEAESFAKSLINDNLKKAFSSQGFEFLEIDAYEDSYETIAWYNQKKYVVNSLFDNI